MSEYKLEIKQLVSYPRCRIYRQFIRMLLRKRDIRIGSHAGLFHYAVLCSYANFRTSYKRIDGISYIVYPGQWLCTTSELAQWFRVRFQHQALAILKEMQDQNLITYTTLGHGKLQHLFYIQVLDVRVSNSYLLSAYDVFHGFMPSDPNDWPYTDYLFIDSGGYEISDTYDLSERNKFNYNVLAWDMDKMKQVYHAVASCTKFSSATIVLSSYDLIAPFKEQLDAAIKLAQDFPDALVNFIIKPAFSFEQLLEHIKENIEKLRQIPILGLTEKELGNTVQTRLLNLISLKQLLDSQNWAGKIHIFGGLEPSLSTLYYFAGADIFAKMLRQRFPKTEIKCGTLAVTVKFSNYEVQLLPAMKNNGKLQIASSDGSHWSASINSTKFTEKLTATNKINGNKVVPVIKLAKSILSKLPPKYQLSGYHVEALAVDAFSTYNGRYTLYDMTKHMLNYSVKRVLNPMNDVTGQSGTIDDKFGPSRSVTRQYLSRHIKDIAGHFSGASSDAKGLFD